MSKIDDLLQQIGSLTVLEAAELKDKMEETFGVSASAPVAVAAAPGGAGDGAEEEQTEFDVLLTAVGSKKIQVIKVVREVTSLGLKEAKAVVDNAPGPVKEGVSKEEAEEIKAKLEEQGRHGGSQVATLNRVAGPGGDRPIGFGLRRDRSRADVAGVQPHTVHEPERPLESGPRCLRISHVLAGFPGEVRFDG